MIKSFPTPAAYAAAGKPTDESRVAQIQSTGEVMVDGVNVLLPQPTDVCAVLFDEEGNDRFVKWDTIIKSLLPAGWTHVGYAFDFDGRRFKVLDKDHTTAKWLNCWQYSITAVSAAAIKFWLHMKGDYAAWVAIEVTLTDSSNGYINATSASEITAALNAAGNTGNVGYDKHGYWAFLANDNDEAVESDGTKIVVQCDLCEDYRQYQISDTTHALAGCTMALSVWGDMPASSATFRKTGASSAGGVMNVERAVIYYSASGSVPTANVAINNATLVKREAFDSSAYCADLRAFYGTYEAYIAANMVLWPHPDYGAFGMIDADEMTRRYATKTFTKKDGTALIKFPALNTALAVGYGTGKYAAGKWHLSDITDGMVYMRDDVMNKLAEAQKRMATTVIANNVTRWFARRSSVYGAWYFGGTNGYLTTNFVYNALRCQAVTLCELD